MGSAAFFDAGGALREVVKTSGGNAAADLVNYTNSRPGGWSNVAIGDTSYPNLLAMDFIAPTAAGLGLRIRQRNYVAQKFGLFICFQIISFTDADIGTGSETNNTFNPSSLSIDQWVSTAVAAKAKYAVLTVKAPDGFCLWPTASTSHNISSTTWYTNNSNLDITASFCTKMRAAGIQPILYFSIWDKQIDGTISTLSQADYKTYTQNQITELLSNYGSMEAIWIDSTAWHFVPINGNGNYPWASYSEFLTFVRGLQANCLLLNNSHSGSNVASTLSDSDLCIYEDTFATVADGNLLPSEWCRPMRSDGNWYWKSSSNPIKTASAILADIAFANARNCAYLLAPCPDNTGNIPANMVTALTTVGSSL